jgi:hypothetical protein
MLAQYLARPFLNYQKGCDVKKLFEPAKRCPEKEKDNEL